MLRKITLVGAAMTAVLTLAHNAVAGGMDNIRINGFINAIGATSDSSTPYLESIDKDGDWTGSNYGLTVTAKVDQKLTLAAQLHGRATGNGMAVFDWAFGRYQFNDIITAKAGKMKYSGNLVSEYVDVGYAYPWVRPPEAVYSEAADLFFESYSGAAALFTFGDDVEYSAEVYGGGDSEVDVTHKKMMGLTLRAVHDYGEVKLAYNRSLLITDNDHNRKNKEYISLGGKMDWNSWLVMAEYVRSQVEEISTHDAYGAFATVGYKLGHFMPHFTYQKFDKDTGANQSSVTLGMRYNLGPATALKLEVQRVKPKGGGLFTSQPIDSSVNVINAAVNFVF